MKSEKIDALILTCAVDVIAEQGDELVVVGDVVVAVRGPERKIIPIAAAEKNYRQRERDTLPSQQDILAAVGENAGTSAQIATRMGFALGNPLRHPLTEKITRMQRCGLLEIVPSHRKRKHIYKAPTHLNGLANFGVPNNTKQ